jgi:hypothetical protein
VGPHHQLPVVAYTKGGRRGFLPVIVLYGLIGLCYALHRRQQRRTRLKEDT